MKRMLFALALALLAVAPLRAITETWTVDFYARNTNFKPEGGTVELIFAIISSPREQSATIATESHVSQKVTATIGANGNLHFKTTFQLPEDYSSWFGNGYMHFVLRDATSDPTNPSSLWISWGTADWSAAGLQTIMNNGKHAEAFLGLGDPVRGDFLDSTVISGTVTPEPTVLALLALGVAGVALRRKVA